jgi:hypothetical protein
MLLTMAAALSLPSGATARTAPPGWLGVTVDGPVTASSTGEWRRMPSAGVESVRSAFRWAVMQPERDGPIDFTITDAIVAAATARGLSVLPVVQQPPAWAAVTPGDRASPPSDPPAVRRIFSALAERYGRTGSFWAERPDLPRLPIRAWQVFNEPSMLVFWSEQPFADRYVATLRAAASGIRRTDPGAKVILAGLTNVSWKDLRKIYRAGGRGLFDAVAVHPYAKQPESVMRVIEKVRGTMDRAGDRRMPIWLTEFSWAGAKGRADSHALFDATPRQQAWRLGEFLRRLTAAREALRVQRAYWYTWQSVEGSREFDYTGLRRIRDGRAVTTPVMSVFTRWARKLQGCRKVAADARRCA